MVGIGGLGKPKRQPRICSVCHKNLEDNADSYSMTKNGELICGECEFKFCDPELKEEESQ